jgi:hypothetical protein
MPQRTRTIQRTPNVGLTLKMQPLQESDPCEPCVPAPTVARWYDETAGTYSLETAIYTAPNPTDGWPRWVPHPHLAAEVQGALCDCEVQWSLEWETATGYGGSVADFWDIMTPGTALVAASRNDLTSEDHPTPGVLTATPTILCESGASITLAPIYLVVELEEYGC